MSEILAKYLGSPINFDKKNNKNDSGSVEIEGKFTNEEEKSERLEGSSVEETRESGEKYKEDCRFKNVVAIVDPPHAGLHPGVIKALRTHPRIRRLVYISRNPDSLVANVIELCTPSPDKTAEMGRAGLARHRTKSMSNCEHFSPVRCMAVDLFQHNSHCGIIMLLNR